MNRNMIVGLALAMGILSVGAVSASAAGPCCGDAPCGDKQAVQQFTQETTALSNALKAKDLELRELNSYDSIDVRKADELEAELKELKGKIRVIATRHGISSCCIS
jgi:peptidoglycan hydrolase CwlO-like protein